MTPRQWREQIQEERTGLCFGGILFARYSDIIWNHGGMKTPQTWNLND